VVHPDMTNDLIAINSMQIILFISVYLEPQTILTTYFYRACCIKITKA